MREREPVLLAGLSFSRPLSLSLSLMDDERWVSSLLVCANWGLVRLADARACLGPCHPRSAGAELGLERLP